MSAILHFLNANAGGITALATLVLVALTGVYVVLTNRMARASRDQVDRMIGAEDEVREQSRRALEALLIRFGATLEHLPAREHREPDRLLGAPTMTDRDLADLERLAYTVGRLDLQQVTVAVLSMRYLKDRMDDVQRGERQGGYDWRLFPWDKWCEVQEEASAAVVELAASLRSSALLKIAHEVSTGDGPPAPPP